MTIPKGKLLWIATLATGLIGMAVALPAQIHAASNPSSTYIVSNNTFRVYVQASENLDVSFTKILNTASNNNSTVTISRPGAANTVCTLDGTTAVGNPSSECILSNLTASQSGIWQILFSGPGSGHDRYDWQINAQNGVVNIPGRVWTGTYVMEQTAPHAGIDVWYQSEYGYLYQATYNDYDGIDSSLAADGLGLIQPGTCHPKYSSISMMIPGYSGYFPSTSCESAYKLFFESPAADLPANSVTWSGSTDWVRPAITNPVISNVGFTSWTPGSRSGGVTFDIANYKGPLVLEVDANNNGVYTDPVDRVIYQSSMSQHLIVFDGNDGNGSAIPTTQAITFRLKVDRTAEIHFLATDVERRAGGIEINRLNGPAGGESTIYWNDTDFPFPDANRCPTPLTGVTPDGTAGVDSSGGAHAWTTTGCPGPQNGNYNNGINGSWGDARVINDWAFVPINVTAAYTLGAYTSPTLAPTGTSQILALVLAALTVTISILAIARRSSFTSDFS